MDSVLQTLHDLGLDPEWTWVARPTQNHGDPTPDGVLSIGPASARAAFPVEVFTSVRPGLIAARGRRGDGAILLADHVTDGVAKALERSGWAGFIDASGNASVRAPGMVVHIAGRRPVKKREAFTQRPFATGGLPVTFALLAHDDETTSPAGLTQRRLGELSGRSAATVNRVVKGLRSAVPPYLDADMTVLRHHDLVAAWTSAYVTVQPAAWPDEHYSSGAWGSPRDVLADELPEGCVVSSEASAAAMGLPIRPVSSLIHCPQEVLPALIRAGRLRRDPEGDVIVRPALWGEALTIGPLAPSWLVRADLLLDDDPRLREIAAQIDIVR